MFEIILIYTFTSSREKLRLASFPTISAPLSISISPESVAAHSYIQPLQQIHRCHKFTKAQNFEFITNDLETSLEKKNKEKISSMKFSRNTKTMRRTAVKSCQTTTTALCLISCLLSQPGVAIFRMIPSSSRQQIHSITQGDPLSLCWPITAFKKPAAPGKL